MLCLFVYSGVQQILCCVCLCIVVYNTYCVVFFASGEVYLKQNYVIKFVGDLRQVGGFLHQKKTDRHDITEIVLKVPLNTIIKPKPKAI